MSNSPILHGVSGLSGGLLARKDIDENPHSTPSEMQCDYIASPSPASTSNGNTEDTLFMHYLDQVFYIQYPFYCFHNRQGRGWVLAILRRARSAYHAALALSERHLLPVPLDKGDTTASLIQLRTQNGHYNLAIQELQRMIRDSCTSTGLAAVKPSLEVLMTLLQIFFFEVRQEISIPEIVFSAKSCQYYRLSPVGEKNGTRISVQLVISSLHFSKISKNA
jgi:hypothetical protein